MELISLISSSKIAKTWSMLCFYKMEHVVIEISFRLELGFLVFISLKSRLTYFIIYNVYAAAFLCSSGREQHHVLLRFLKFVNITYKGFLHMLL